MAESVVSFLLEKLYSLVETEVKHLGGIKDGVVDVKDELEQMKAFLRDADSKEDEDEGVRAWVKQVRDLALDSEDIIDLFLLQFERPLQHGYFGRLSKIYRTVKTLKARHQVASDLQRIKSRAESISIVRQRYQHEWNLEPKGGSSSADILNDRRNDARLVHEAMLVGIETPKRELVEHVLANTKSCRVLAVHGMGGLGKTTLVHQVYVDARVKKRYQHRAWIAVSQSFNVQDLLLKIIKQLFDRIGKAVPEEVRSMDIHSLKEYVKNFLGDKLYLIVLDDVWTTGSWDSLKYAFPDNNCGSHLIITTRDCGIAKFITEDLSEGIGYPLNALTPKESWELFCARVFKGKPCPENLKEVSWQILKRCKGLPLGIVAISGVLANKGRSPEEWERVRRGMAAKLGDMKKILSLSIDDLPYDLKSCFMYLSMFPEDFSTGNQFIIKLWIAEGFVTQMEDLTLEEVGDRYLSELLNRSMIQVTTEEFADEDHFRFQVHDLMREIILQKSMSQNFCSAVSEQSVIVPEGVRRLSVVESPILENSDRDLNLSRLRSFLFIPSRGSASSCASYLEYLQKCGVRLLKVLEYPNLSMDIFPKFITQQYNLRYISLRGSKVKSIPRSIGRLRNLETLNLIDTLVEELPVEILEIRSLRHIMVSHRDSRSVKVPTGIGRLTSLQTLDAIQVGVGGLDLIRSLGDLKQLRVLDIKQLREEHGATLCSSIEQLSHLRYLWMELKGENEILDVQYISSPPPFLKHLAMGGCLLKLPSWVSKLESLERLSLRWSKLKLDALESLQALPNLIRLEFYDQTYDGEELCFRAGGFQMLKKLVLYNEGTLRRITLEKGAMPCLQELRLQNCKLLEEVPSGIEFLANLENLSLIGMGDQLVTRLRSTTEDSDFQRIKRVPFLKMGSFGAEGRFVPYRQT